MRPGNYPLEVYRGDSFAWEFVCWKDAEKTEPSDLTDVTAVAQIRKTYGDAMVMDMDCTIQESSIFVDLTPEMWKAWPVKQKTGVWDLQITYADGSVVTLVAGKVTIDPDVTDA